MKNIGIISLWEDLEAKLLTPGQLLGYPWKVWGITVQTSYWEGRWHQNWVRSRLTKKIRVRTCKFVKNGNFLLFGLQLEKEERYRDGFGSKIKIGAGKVFVTPPKLFFSLLKKGQLWAGKTRSKRPRSHCLSTVHLLPYMWASFYPLDPSRYLSSFSSWRPKTKKFPFFTKFRCRTRLFLLACCGLNFDATDLPNS